MASCISLEVHNYMSIFEHHYTDVGEIHSSNMNMHNSHMNPHLWFICLHASSAVHASSRKPSLCLTYYRNDLDHNRVDKAPLGLHNGWYTEKI